MIASGMASNMPNWANHIIQVPAKELPARDRKEMGLSRVAKMETEVTHQGIVPTPLKYALPFFAFGEIHTDQ